MAALSQNKVKADSIREKKTNKKRAEATGIELWLLITGNGEPFADKRSSNIKIRCHKKKVKQNQGEGYERRVRNTDERLSAIGGGFLKRSARRNPKRKGKRKRAATTGIQPWLLITGDPKLNSYIAQRSTESIDK